VSVYPGINRLGSAFGFLVDPILQKPAWQRPRVNAESHDDRLRKRRSLRLHCTGAWHGSFGPRAIWLRAWAAAYDFTGPRRATRARPRGWHHDTSTAFM
jgi:hypothetical protein